MNRIWGHTLSSAVLAIMAGGAFPACAHNNGSLFVYGVLAPPTPAGGLCTYTAAPTSPGLPRGTVDAAIVLGGYEPTFLIGSSLVAQANATTPQSESNRLTIQGADVRVVDPVDNSEWMNANVLTSGTVDAAAGVTPSYLALPTAVMDSKAIGHFNPQGTSVGSRLAEVYVTFYGETLGNESIRSEEFLFPVDVCYGCLVSFPPGAIVAADSTNPPLTASPYCSGTGTLTTASAAAAACVPGQDQAVDCRACYPAHSACAGVD